MHPQAYAPLKFVVTATTTTTITALTNTSTSSLPVLQGEYKLLSTDYFYYALAWQCEDLPLGLGHTGTYLMQCSVSLLSEVPVPVIHCSLEA